MFEMSGVVKMETMGKWIFNEKCILQQTKELKMVSPLAINFDIDFAKIAGAIIGTKAYGILVHAEEMILLFARKMVTKDDKMKEYIKPLLI